MRKFIKKFKNSIIGKILKFIWKTLWLIFEIVFIFLAIVIATQKLTKNEKAFLGFRIFSVATGSMEPEYAVGDILIAKEKDPSTIEVGDNIVYLGKVADYKGKIITHNVIEVEQNEEGDYLFHTKGIANTIEDPIVHEEQLYGVISYNNELLAWICKILTNRYGLYCFIVVVIIYFFIGFVRNQGERIEQEKEEERKRREKQKTKMKKQKEQEVIDTEQEETGVEEVVTNEKNNKPINFKKETLPKTTAGKAKITTEKKETLPKTTAGKGKSTTEKKETLPKTTAGKGKSTTEKKETLPKTTAVKAKSTTEKKETLPKTTAVKAKSATAKKETTSKTIRTKKQEEN